MTTALEVTYHGGDPSRIETSGGFDQRFVFAVESGTARLVDVRSKVEIGEGCSVMSVSELTRARDAVLELPFVDDCTVWMDIHGTDQPAQEGDE